MEVYVPVAMNPSGLVQKVKRASSSETVVRLGDPTPISRLRPDQSESAKEKVSSSRPAPEISTSTNRARTSSSDLIESIKEEAYERAGREVLSGQFDPACYAKASLACRGRDQDLENTYIEMRAFELYRRIKTDREKKAVLPRLIVAQPDAPRVQVSSKNTVHKKVVGKLSLLILHSAIIFGVCGTLIGLTTRMNQFVNLSLMPHIGMAALILSIVPYALYRVLKCKLDFLQYIQVLALSAGFSALCSLGTAFLLVKGDVKGYTFDAPIVEEEGK